MILFLSYLLGRFCWAATVLLVRCAVFALVALCAAVAWCIASAVDSRRGGTATRDAVQRALAGVRLP